MKKIRQLITHGSRQPHNTIPVLGKKLGMLLLCSMLVCSAGTGCSSAHGKTKDTEETAKEETQDMGVGKSGVTGTIAVSGREEREAAEQVVEKLFRALEAGDEAAIRGLFSPYAIENAADLDGKIREMIDYYPGADGGYTGSCITTNDKDAGKIRQILDIALMVTDEGKDYELVICLQMRNDYEPSMEGVHLIEMIKVEEEPAGFQWKNEDDAPGVYVAE